MLANIGQYDPGDLAGAALVWFMGLIFLAISGFAFVRYLREGR